MALVPDQRSGDYLFWTDTAASLVRLATGIGLGFITYVLCKVIAGKFSEARPAVIVLAVLFAIKFAIAG